MHKVQSKMKPDQHSQTYQAHTHTHIHTRKQSHTQAFAIKKQIKGIIEKREKQQAAVTLNKRKNNMATAAHKKKTKQNKKETNERTKPQNVSCLRSFEYRINVACHCQRWPNNSNSVRRTYKQTNDTHTYIHTCTENNHERL